MATARETTRSRIVIGFDGSQGLAGRRHGFASLPGGPAIESAGNKVRALEELHDAQLEDLRQQFDKLAQSARAGGRGTLDCPEIKDADHEGHART